MRSHALVLSEPLCLSELPFSLTKGSATETLRVTSPPPNLRHTELERAHVRPRHYAGLGIYVAKRLMRGHNSVMGAWLSGGMPRAGSSEGGGVGSGQRKNRGDGKGLVFVISAPSGAGKTTVLNRVLKELPGLRFSVSYTTRSPRGNEQDGRDYHFVTPGSFQRMIDAGEFLEWAEVLGNRYGTGKIDVDLLDSDGVDLVLDIDTQGAKKVREKVHRPIFIFILPPSPRLLEKRLVDRGLDSPETIRFRLASAMKEISEAHWYDYIIVNERLEEAVGQLKAIIIAERCRKLKNKLEKELTHWEENDGKDHG